MKDTTPLIPLLAILICFLSYGLGYIAGTFRPRRRPRQRQWKRPKEPMTY